jgi:RecA/RadA recombinase
MAKAKDPQAELDKVLRALEKELGEGMVHRASTSPPVRHLAFRNPTLNYATEGGVPWGRTTSMYGDFSTGKAVALDTPIPTPSGWTTMGEIEIGDLVFDEKGQPTRVVFTSQVHVGHDCYRVEFDDGSEIIADADHRWMTSTYLSRQAQKRAMQRVRSTSGTQRGLGQQPQPLYSVRTTAEIAQDVGFGSMQCANHAIPNACQLDLPEASLPIDPYTLGVWLGDGTSSVGEYSKPDEELAWHIRAAGYEVIERPQPTRCTRWTVKGLITQLRQNNLYRNKHVPDRYLRASAGQRLALLQGLMDTDGYVENSGRCEFTSTSQRLADQTYELICSLGFKARMTEGRAQLEGRDCGPKWRIGFTPDKPVFKLRRKLDRQKPALERKGYSHRLRKIVSCEQVESVPTRCLQVESDSHLFLIGKQMVVTHNTLALYELYAMAQQLPHSMDPLLVARIQYHQALGHDRVVDELVLEREWIHDHFPDGATCCHYDIEGQFDKKRAAQIGIDLDALFLVESDVIEDVCKTLESLWGFFHVHGLDSTSAAKSLLMLKQEPGKSAGYGVDARQWKEALKHALAYFGPLKNGTGIENMLLMVHQTSTNTRTGAREAQSSQFLKFHSSCTIKFERGRFLWYRGGDRYADLIGDKAKAYGSSDAADEQSMSGRAEADGVEVYAKIEKSRTCRPFRTAGMQFDYKRLKHTIPHELASTGLYFGYIEKAGSWFRIPGEEKPLGQGLKHVYARLAEDDDLRTKIMCRLLDFTDEGDSIDLAKSIEAAQVVDEATAVLQVA